MRRSVASRRPLYCRKTVGRGGVDSAKSKDAAAAAVGAADTSAVVQWRTRTAEAAWHCPAADIVRQDRRPTSILCRSHRRTNARTQVALSKPLTGGPPTRPGDPHWSPTNVGLLSLPDIRSLIAKFHYTGPTEPDRTGPDQTRISDKVRGLCLVRSGRAHVVEFSYYLTRNLI